MKGVGSDRGIGECLYTHEFNEASMGRYEFPEFPEFY